MKGTLYCLNRSLLVAGLRASASSLMMEIP